MNVDSFRNLLHNELEDFRFIFYNLDYNNQILLSTDLFADDENRRLEIIFRNPLINRQLLIEQMLAALQRRKMLKMNWG